MKYRKLRIAWSVSWGIVALLLCVLWVRSYWWFDNLNLSRAESKVIQSFRGGIALVCNARASTTGFTTIAAEEVLSWFESTKRVFKPDWRFTVDRDGANIRCPQWFLVVIAAIIGLIPWLPLSNSFSLRTLLIATTLIAVVLGAVVASW
jgi:hypothetical protein